MRLHRPLTVGVGAGRVHLNEVPGPHGACLQDNCTGMLPISWIILDRAGSGPTGLQGSWRQVLREPLDAHMKSIL